MKATSTGVDLRARLIDLALDMQRRSAAKQAHLPNPLVATIRYSPARKAWGTHPRTGRFGYHDWPERWGIVYVRNGPSGELEHSFGVCIGTSRAAAVRWLILQERQWG